MAVAKLSPGAEATAAPLRLGNSAPAPTPEQQHAGQPLGDELAASRPTCVTNQNTAGAPEQRRRHEHGAVAEALGEPARRSGDGGGDERAGRHRQAGLEHRVVPDGGQEEDVAQRVAVEAAPPRRSSSRWRPRRSAMRSSAEVERAARGGGRERHDEVRAERDRDGPRAEHAWVGPAPLLALDDAEHQRRDRHREARPTRAGRAPGGGPGARLSTRWRRESTYAAMPTGTLTRKTSRQSDSGDQQAAQRRADARGQRGDRAEQCDRVRAALGREGVEHQRQRRRARPAPRRRAWRTRYAVKRVGASGRSRRARTRP